MKKGSISCRQRNSSDTIGPPSQYMEWKCKWKFSKLCTRLLGDQVHGMDLETQQVTKAIQ